MNGGKRPASKQNRLREVVEKGWDETIIGVKGVALQVCVLVHDRDERCRGVRWKFGDRLLLKRTRKRKCINNFIPLLEYTKELGETSDLELKTKDSFIVGNLLKTQVKYNFILAVAFALSGDYSCLLNLHKDLDLDLVDRMVIFTIRLKEQ